MPFAVVLALTLQTAGGGVVPPPTATTATAVRAAHPPAIDGRDDDPVWREAPAITQFREFQPKQDGDPRFATEAKVAYDDRNIYVFIRAFDPHPDSILRLLARRDVRAATDQLKILIDSYHDRRSGYEFAVNPAGVKRDYAIYNDTQEDDAWTPCGRSPRPSTRSAGRPSSESRCRSSATCPAAPTRSASACGVTSSPTPSRSAGRLSAQ